MKKLSFLALSLVVMILALVGISRVKHFTIKHSTRSEQISNIRTVEGNDCGPRALQFICLYAGIETDLPELVELAGTNQNGTTVGNLISAAQVVGLKAEAVIVNIKELEKRVKKLKLPAIVFVDNNHFIVVRNVEMDRVHIVDPPASSVHIPTQQFLKRWKGHTLFFSRETEADNGPRIRFDKALYDFGEIASGQKVTHVFMYTNVGNKPLQINRVDSSCVCTEVFSSGPTPPGLSGEISVTYHAQSQIGVSTQQIRVISNDRRKPVTILTIKGNVRDIPRPFPQKLAFTEQNEVKEILIKNPTQYPFRVIQVDVDTPQLITDPPKSEVQAGGETVITISLNQRIVSGPFQAKLLVHINHPDISTIELPIEYLLKWTHCRGQNDVKISKIIESFWVFL